jgi:hypothetical protein
MPKKDSYQDCKIGTVCVWGGTCARGEGGWRRLKQGNMVNGLHVSLQNRTMEPLAFALSEAGKGSK